MAFRLPTRLAELHLLTCVAAAGRGANAVFCGAPVAYCRQCGMARLLEPLFDHYRTGAMIHLDKNVQRLDPAWASQPEPIKEPSTRRMAQPVPSPAPQPSLR